MLPHNTENENNKVNVQFTNAIKELQISKLLKQANIRKDSRSVAGRGDRERRTAFEIFQFLLLLVFQGRSLFGFLGSKKQNIACSKNTYYRFLNKANHIWKKFLMLLACKAISYFSTLTRPERVKCLVMDDSVIGRCRSKKVELLSWIFDHVIHKSVKGFCMLTLAWTDDYSIIPAAFNMLASKRLVSDASADIDKRTNGAKRRKEAVLSKPLPAWFGKHWKRESRPATCL